MKRLMVAVGSAILAATVIAATPVSAGVTPISIHCDGTRISEWTVAREWVSGTVVHIRDESADYRNSGSPYCAGVNHARVDVNLDLATGEGIVSANARVELDAFDGGWDLRLVAHFTPGGPYIWEGQTVGHGFGALAGYEYRGTVLETSHEATIEDSVIFLPGS